MANYKAMTAFKKALAAPEDHFDIGTSFRSGDGIVITKLDEDLWVYLQQVDDAPGRVETDTLEMQDVISTVRNSATEWEVSHNWKPAKASTQGDIDDDDDAEDQGPPAHAKAKGCGKAKKPKPEPEPEEVEDAEIVDEEDESVS